MQARQIKPVLLRREPRRNATNSRYVRGLSVSFVTSVPVNPGTLELLDNSHHRHPLRTANSRASRHVVGTQGGPCPLLLHPLADIDITKLQCERPLGPLDWTPGIPGS